MQSKKKNRKRNQKPASKSRLYSLMPDNFEIGLKHAQRSQVSGPSFTVYNFETTTLQTLQPSYRDQLLAIWNQYVVLGVTITLKIVNKSTSVDAEVLAYHGDGFTVTGLSLNQVLEFKNTRRFMLTACGNGKTISFTQRLNLIDYLPEKFWNDSRFWGSAGAGPSYSTDRGYQHAVGFVAADGVSAVSVTMDRQIVFHVRFFTLAPIALSSLGGAADTKPTLMGSADQDSSDEGSPTEVISSARRSNLKAKDGTVCVSKKTK